MVFLEFKIQLFYKLPINFKLEKVCDLQEETKNSNYFQLSEENIESTIVIYYKFFISYRI